MKNPAQKAPFKDPVEYLVQGCERPWEVDVQPFEVAERTYYVGNDWVGAYLLDTTDGLVLIDSTMLPQVYLVLENIRRLGFDPRDIKLLLLSHMHYDHVGGARAIAELSGARIMMSREDHDFLRDRPEQLFNFNYPCGTFDIDAYYEWGTPIVMGDRSIEPVLTPGHTPGTTSFFFDVKDRNGANRTCGLHGGVGLNTLMDDFLQEHGFPATTRTDYLRSMQRLKQRHVDIVLGSHPAQVDMMSKVPLISPEHNPFDDPDVWQNLISQRVAQLEKMISTSALEPAC